MVCFQRWYTLKDTRSMSLLGNRLLVPEVLLGQPHGSGTLIPTDMSTISAVYIPKRTLIKGLSQPPLTFGAVTKI